MAKSTRKNLKGRILTKKVKKSRKNAKGQLKIAEYIDCLSELHKLQGELLTQLKKEI